MFMFCCHELNSLAFGQIGELLSWLPFWYFWVISLSYEAKRNIRGYPSAEFMLLNSLVPVFLGFGLHFPGQP